MESSVLSAVVLPIALAIIMVGVGLEIKLADFGLLMKRPRPIVAGLLAQMLLLPLLGILIGLYLFKFAGPLVGAGFVILTLAPGGVTSNLMTLLAKGDLALSVFLTALVSLITPFWLPFAAAMILSHVSEAQNIELNMVKTIAELFVVTVIPVLIGMLIRAKKQVLAAKLEKPVKVFAVVFLILIVIALVFKNKDVLLQNFSQVALATLLLVVLAYLGGYLIARLFATNSAQVRSISMEVGIQNGTLALLVTATILKIPEMTLAAMFYSLIMFVVGFIAVALFKYSDKKALNI